MTYHTKNKYSKAQIDTALKELFGDKNMALYADEGEPAFRRAEAVFLLQGRGVMPQGDNASSVQKSDNY